MDSELNKATSVDRKRRKSRKVFLASLLKGFDSEIVGDEHRNPALLDPLQQARVRSVEHRISMMQKFDVGASLAGRDRISPAGVYAEHVAFLDNDIILLENPHQVGV